MASSSGLPRMRMKTARTDAAHAWPERGVSILNGMVGDYLQRRGNELAIAMSFCHEGRLLDLNETSLRAAHATLTGKICVLVHGFCCNESVWTFPATATAAQPDTYARGCSATSTTRRSRSATTRDCRSRKAVSTWRNCCATWSLRIRYPSPRSR